MRRAVLILCVVLSAFGQLFGPYAGYNLLTFGDFSCANSDVRGRLAIGGNAVLHNYNVACQGNQATNPTTTDQCQNFGSWTCNDLAAQGYPRGTPNYYGLTAAKSLNIQNAQVSGGIAWGTSVGANNWVGVQTISNCAADAASPTSPLNFATGQTFFAGLSTKLAQMPATGTVTNSYGTLSFVGTGTTGTEVFFVDGNVLSAANTLSGLTNVNAASIYINVNGTTISLAGGNAALKQYAKKIVWNFYQATTINVINYSVFGSIVAPTADLKNPAGVLWGQFFVNSFTSGSSDATNPNLCAQVNWVPYSGPSLPAPASYCGDGIVSGTEQCDIGSNNGASSTCCSSTCMYVPSASVCRAAVGDCDAVETCTGTSASCPTDAFLPSTTRCSHPFGICNVELQYHCPGNSATCINSAPAALFTWDAFNVISFDSFTATAGDVEGALAVRNAAVLTDFDLGLKINDSDIYTLFSLAVAGDVTWSSGAVHPTAGHPYPITDSNGHSASLAEGYIGIGGVLRAPAYFNNSRLQNVYLTAGQFDAAQQYYMTISSLLAALPTNVVVSQVYGDGLLLTCNNVTDLYHATVDGAILSGTNWYVSSGCKFGAAWIIDVTGTGSVSIRGGPIPGIVEKVVYNILGSGRTIYGLTGVSGNILSPQNIYSQSTGVTYGRVIVGNVTVARQNNKPDCVNFQAVQITNVNTHPVKIGDQLIYVVDVSNYAVGDTICTPAYECKKILSGTVQLNPDGTFNAIINVDSPYAASVDSGSLLVTAVDAQDTNRTSIPVTTINSSSSTISSTPTMSSQNANPSSGVEHLSASVLVALLMALLFC